MKPGQVLSAVLVLVLAGVSWAEEDYQQWSVQTYLAEEYTFTCNDSLYPVYLNQDDQLTWRRHGHDSPIVNDENYKLTTMSGIPSMGLTIKDVTDDMAGIYFCEIRSASGDFVARVLKALNLGGRKYHDKMDKYRRKIILGFIVGGSVFVFVVGACALDHFRYQSEEERREKREAKEMRKRRKHELKNGGYDNIGMEMPPSGNGHGKVPLNDYSDIGNEVNTAM